MYVTSGIKICENYGFRFTTHDVILKEKQTNKQAKINLLNILSLPILYVTSGIKISENYVFRFTIYNVILKEKQTKKQAKISNLNILNLSYFVKFEERYSLHEGLEPRVVPGSYLGTEELSSTNIKIPQKNMQKYKCKYN